MRHLRDLRAASASCLASVFLLASGCAPDEPSLSQESTVLLEGRGGAGGGRDEQPLDDGVGDEVTELLAAFDDEGALVLVDPTEGARVVARRPLGAGVEPTDLVFDAARGRLVVVVKPPPFEESAVVEVALDGETLGEPKALGKAIGDARAMPIDGGIVLATHEDSRRVRLMRDDGVRTRGRALPEPRSWWQADAGRRIDGLACDGHGEIVVFGLVVGDDGSIEVRDQAMVGSGSDDARLVPGITVQGGDGARSAPAEVVLHDEVTGALRFAPMDGSAPRALSFTAGKLEGALRWEGAIALTTRAPDALLVVEREWEAAVSLPEGVRSGTPFGRHDLAVAGERLFVATGGRIMAVRRRDGDGSVPEPDASFPGEHLRGPVAVIVR